MSSKKYPISNIHIPRFTEAIQNHIKDEQVKSLFLDFFKYEYSIKESFRATQRTLIHRHFVEIIITLFSDYTIQLICWEQYCLGMTAIRQQNWGGKDLQDAHTTRFLARKLLSDFYQYAIENTNIDTEGIVELREHKDFLIHQERLSIKFNDTLGDHLFDQLRTNFPIGTSLSELHLIQSDGKSEPTILNLNVLNKEVKKLLIEYYLIAIKTRSANGLRAFVYLFKYSLLALETQPQSITDFTFNVFKKQYRFYRKANIINPSKSTHFIIHLYSFYSFLFKKLKELDIPNNIFEGTLHNELLFGNDKFNHFYENGYKVLKYNPFESVPSENRWLLIISDSYASGAPTNRGIDFTQIKDRSLRDDLKNYLWKQSSMSFDSATHHSNYLIEFLNFISSYKKRNKIQEDKYVDANLLDEWNLHISWKKTTFINSYTSKIRAYLKFYKEEYQIPILVIDTLLQLPTDKDGGIPMTKKDFDLFTRKFKEKSLKNTSGELGYIIYNLLATTKLRPGEILKLERDCIVKKSEQTGVIQYYSKTSRGKKVRVTLPIEKINLIEKAILLTEQASSKANEDIAKYIFVKEDEKKKFRIIRLTAQFATLFSEIQKELEGQLDNIYHPYSLRKTFIDNLYTEGIKDGLPTSVIAEMAGNGANTAIKYYRKASREQEYAEMFAGVIISGVDVNGKIIDEENVDSLNPVEEGLGGCKLVGCVIDDEEYKCLMCSYFATTPSKIPLFKSKITRLKAIKESTLNGRERDIIDAELKLYTTYYAKLLEQMGDD